MNRNSVLKALPFAAAGGGATILDALANGGAGPAVNYIVKIELIEVTAGAGSVGINGINIDIPAAVPVGSYYSFSFGDGLRLTAGVTIDGAGTRSGVITYYVGN